MVLVLESVLASYIPLSRGLALYCEAGYQTRVSLGRYIILTLHKLFS